MSETISAKDFPNLQQTIEAAEYPLILLIVGGPCDQLNAFEDELSRRLQEQPENVIYYVFCVPDRDQFFPRIEIPAVYYHVPKNPVPVFWRGRDAIARLAEDIPVLCKMARGMSEAEARFTPEERASISKMDQMLSTEDVSKFPPLFQQFRSAAKETWAAGKRALAGLPVLLPAEEAYARLAVCEGCDRFDQKTSRCRECGCSMRLKTQLVSGRCPLSKWPVA